MSSSCAKEVGLMLAEIFCPCSWSRWRGGVVSLIMFDPWDFSANSTWRFYQDEMHGFFFGIVKGSRVHSDSLRHLVSLFVVWWSCHFLLGMHHFWIPQTTLVRGGWRVDPLILLWSCCTFLGVQSAISIHGKFQAKKRQVGNALNKHFKRINAPPLQTVNDSNVYWLMYNYQRKLPRQPQKKMILFKL